MELNSRKITDFLFKGYKSIKKDEATFIKDVMHLKPSETITLFKANYQKINIGNLHIILITKLNITMPYRK